MEDKKPVIVKKLSRGVLDLKFMKKSKEKAEIQDDNEERQVLYQDQLSALHNSAHNVVVMGSHFDIMTYLPGRLSFGGMEPNIEKLNEDKLTGLYKVRKTAEKDEANEEDVSREEMAQFFSSLDGSLKKKFNKRSCHAEYIPPHKRTKGSKMLKPPE